MEKKCLGIEHCLQYQEEVAIPRIEKEMLKEEIPQKRDNVEKKL